MHYGVISQESNSVNISHLKISFYLKKKSIFAHDGKNTSYTGENYQKNQLLRYTLERFLGQTNKINKIFV